MITINFINVFSDFSILSLLEVISVACILYYIYAKTSAPYLLSCIFPNLNSNIQRGTAKINSISQEFTSSVARFSQFKNAMHEVNVDSSPHGKDTTNMLLCTPHAGRKPYSSLFDWGNYFQHIAQAVRNKKYEYPQVSNTVLKDVQFLRTINQATEDEIKEIQNREHEKHDHEDFLENEQILYNQKLKKQEKRGFSILHDMRSTINHFLLAFTSWLLYKLLPCFLSGIVTHTKQIEMLKSVSEKSPGVPLIFLPLHRSHLDYIMVTFILTNNDIKSPLVAAGNNLQIPIFGGLLRGLGAFFIKRKIDPIIGKKDILYRATLQLYIEHALKMGHNIEFFIEGGRSRSGKPCLPKNGILSVIVNAFMDGSIPDALLVPVSVNYEKLVDGNFVQEQTGQKKIPESFKQAVLGIWKTLNSKYGLMRIDFNEPYSIKELVLTYNKIGQLNGEKKMYKPNTRRLQHNQSTSSLYGTDVVCEEHRNLVDSISRQIVFDCAAATSVMTTNALAFLLLTEYRNGATESELSVSLNELRFDLQGHRDLGFSGESIDIIRYAADLLGKDLVVCTKKDNICFIKPNKSIECFIELSYYANTVTPHYILESLTLVVLHNLLKGKPKSEGVIRKLLIDTIIEQCDILRYEYILNKPTQRLDSLIEDCIDKLSEKKCINIRRENEDNNIMNTKLSSLLEIDDPNDCPVMEVPDIYINLSNVQKHNSIISIIAPISYAYMTVAKSIENLKDTSMVESEFVKLVLNQIKQEFNNDNCPYGESVSTDYVKNCLKLFEKWSVIDIYSRHGLRLLSLSQTYSSSSNELKSIISRVARIIPPELN